MYYNPSISGEMTGEVREVAHAGSGYSTERRSAKSDARTSCTGSSASGASASIANGNVYSLKVVEYATRR
jgi:hypothetical protein